MRRPPFSPRNIDGKFAEVLRGFERSPNFTGLAPGTQANYRRQIAWAEAVLGQFLIDDLEPSLVQEALDGIAHLPGKQQSAKTLLLAVEKWAVVRKKLPRQITLGTQVIGSNGGHEPWTNDQVALAERYARPCMARAVTLAVHLGQRGSDLIRMRFTDIEEQAHPITGRRYPGIHVVQKKTGIRLWVPFTDELHEKVQAWRREMAPPWLILMRANGQPFEKKQLSNTWEADRDHVPELKPLSEAGMVLHGLRGTCVVRLRKAGASVLQICSMVGMSEPMVTRYSRLADQVDMAIAAVHHLNVGAARTTQERKTAGEAKK